MTMDFDSLHFVTFRKVILSGGVIALLLWLAVSTNPSKHREQLLNEFIAKGELPAISNWSMAGRRGLIAAWFRTRSTTPDIQTTPND